MPNTSIQHSALFLKEVLGAKVKLVTGFKGTAEIRLAMQSGEVNSVITGWETLSVSNFKDFESGEWLILSQWVDEPLTDLPQKNVPSIYQFARNDEERQMLKFGLVKPNSYARPYAMPPGVPLDRVRAVEAAFLKSLKRSGVCRRSRENQHDREPDRRYRAAQNVRRRVVHAGAAQGEAQTDPRAEGLISESRRFGFGEFVRAYSCGNSW